MKNFSNRQIKILAKNSSWVFLESIFRTVLNFARSIFIARILGAELYGTFALVVAFCVTTQEFFNLNLGTTVVKFGAELISEKRRDLLNNLVGGAIVITAISSGLSILIIGLLMIFSYNSFFKLPGLTIFVIGYAVAWSSNYFDYISSSVLRLFFKFKINSIARIIMLLTEFIIIIATLFLFGKDLKIFFTAVILARLLNSIIINSVAFLEIKDEFEPRSVDKLKSFKRRWNEIKFFTINNSLSRTVFNVINQGDVLLVGLLTGAKEAGYYSIAKKLAFSVLRLSDPLTNAVFPQFSQLIADKKFGDVKNMISKFLKLFSLPSGIFLVIVYFTRTEIISVIYGSEYLPASNIFFMLMIVAVIMALGFWNLPLIQAAGKVGIRLVIYIIAFALEVIAALLLYPYYHTEGVAFAIFGAFLLINIFFAAINFRYLNDKSI